MVFFSPGKLFLKIKIQDFERISRAVQFLSIKLWFLCNFSARLHSVKIDEETQTPEPSETREIPLNIRQHPVAATFGIFDE